MVDKFVRIECCCFCSILIVVISVQIVCWNIWSNWFLKFLFKLKIDVFAQIACFYFCPNWLLIFLFKLTVDNFIQNRLLIGEFNWIVDMSVQILGLYSIQNNCWCFCSDILLTSLFTTDCWKFCPKWLLMFLVKFDY